MYLEGGRNYSNEHAGGSLNCYAAESKQEGQENVNRIQEDKEQERKLRREEAKGIQRTLRLYHNAPFSPGSKEYERYMRFKMRHKDTEEERYNADRNVGREEPQIATVSTKTESEKRDTSASHHEKEMPQTPEEYVKNAISLIKSATLEEGDHPEEEWEQLAKEKEEALQMLRQIFSNDIPRYIDAIAALERSGNIYRSDNDEQGVIRMRDKMRSIVHDALMSDINMAIRFIAHAFADIDRNAIEQWEDDLYERTGREPLDVKRVKFPPQIFIPDNVNFKRREDITEWAVNIYEHLSSIFPQQKKD